MTDQTPLTPVLYPLLSTAGPTSRRRPTSRAPLRGLTDAPGPGSPTPNPPAAGLPGYS
ncbi:hypothetical protein [Prauserella alba]|nr:hypothetical protein [Prauserella alba]